MATKNRFPVGRQALTVQLPGSINRSGWIHTQTRRCTGIQQPAVGASRPTTRATGPSQPACGSLDRSKRREPAGRSAPPQQQLGRNCHRARGDPLSGHPHARAPDSFINPAAGGFSSRARASSRREKRKARARSPPPGRSPLWISVTSASAPPPRRKIPHGQEKGVNCSS